jgi:hypothetical protein
VGGDARWPRISTDGHFATLYLSPRDYHRIHMPCAGRLLRMIHVPGALFSVNPTTARGVPGLFARNERVVCVFDGDARPLRAGAGGRHHRRQHGHGVARRGQPAAAGPVRDWSYADREPCAGAAAPRWAASCSAPRWCCCSRPAPAASTRPGRPAAPSAWARRWLDGAGGWAWCWRCWACCSSSPRATCDNLLAVRFVAGDGWIVAAALSWVAYSVLLKRWPSALGPGERLVAIIAGGLLVLLPFTLLEAR